MAKHARTENDGSKVKGSAHRGKAQELLPTELRRTEPVGLLPSTSPIGQQKHMTP